MVANFCGPPGDDCRELSSPVKSCAIKGVKRQPSPEFSSLDREFGPFPFGCRRFVVGITQCAREELMARRPYVTQVDLRFGNSPCELKNLRGGACSGNVTREWLNFFRQSGIGKDGQA